LICLHIPSKVYLVLDTNAFSSFISNGIWASRVLSARHLHIPLPVLAELRYGFRKGNRQAQNEAGLAAFLAGSNVSVLSPDTLTTFHYAEIRYHLARQGTPIPVNDIWIAALALQHGLHLCTSDAHFDHIPQLLRAQP